MVLVGFNLRAETAANITGDLKGSDGAVYNPSLAWSLGFDCDLVWGIKTNLQCNETIRLFDSEVGGDAQTDIEAGTDVTATRITASLSKKFLRDELEIKASAIWEIESGAALVMPAVTWAKDDIAVELSGGIFVGDTGGLFGQFHDNSFVKAAITYTF
ncbi:hypothetical protein FACS1894109_11360 [Spirochaetia bacterium]|nr:hypothetical protein FACS1894109_11360 [Spirochaetia bacterium]